MEFYVKNVGLISESLVRCEGITVITGLNGSGKSSFLKAITSVILASNEYEKHFLKDRVDYIKKQLLKPFKVMGFSINESNLSRGRIAEYFPVLTSFLSDNSLSFEDGERMAYLVKKIEDEIEYNKSKLFYITELYSYDAGWLDRSGRDKDALIKRINERIYENFLDVFGEINLFLSNNASLKNYLFSRITIQLDSAFNNQLFPMNKRDELFSRISVKNNDSFLNYVRTFDGRVTNSELYGNLPFENVYYIQEASVIDDVRNIARRLSDPESFATDSNGIKTTSFNDALLNDLVAKRTPIDVNLNEERYFKILDLLDATVNYDLRIVGSTLRSSNGGLSIKNEASGSKIFLILKTLIKKGFINKNTILFLDEPENHLHPEWQQLLGKCLVLMSEIIGCKFIIATHSPSFLLSLDVYGKNLKKEGKFNVYFGEKNDGFSTFKDCTFEIEYAHKKLNEPYILMDLFGNTND